MTRAVRERREYVLPVRLDDTELLGLDPDAVYLLASQYTPDGLAEAITRKLLLLGGTVPATRGVVDVGWTQATAGRTTADLCVSIAGEAGEPLTGVDVLAVAANGTRVSGRSGADGEALIRLPSRRLMTIFCAAEGRAAAIVRDHDPEDDLEVVLPERERIGSAIFEAGTGYLPGLAGRLNPIRDPDGRLSLYADNVSINESPHQPATFELGQPLGLEDAEGARLLVTILEVIGRSSLLQYEW